ncbi:cysteine desulfurase [Oenococcus oeni]|uniref:cysteine desulfurase n=1 Tax=Oenococcus oeni TaxID=1247 RepID=UPI00107A35B6|nr:cysteine desulfurase [Oenococcus oeni]AVI94299.1 cysteine sulfinate desulfinase [Oenococcus oeni]SYV98136.1 cysteine desulfurase [Oenococcus oeni]SYW00045.1 cysteine desulfurase [Oenococcus oeni]SYW17420.1 cysteine desulfurase [Oenococcus oeni]VDC14853.1 cysteine desulfurase [Oenococcus oeni]
MSKNQFRDDFPILNNVKMNDEPLAYLDNAATSQKPQLVIDRISRYYSYENANIHRATHALALKATDDYEQVRDQVRNFINAKSRDEIIFTRSTTESLNWVAQRWGEAKLKPGDEIVLSILEHHSNLVPWQQVAKKTGARLRFLDFNQEGVIDLNAAKKTINAKTKIVSITQVSNVLGSIQPVKELAIMAHQVNAIMIVDAAQSVPHFKIDVQNLDCDFLAFSAHKMLGPTGVGVLYGKSELLEKIDPEFFGGEMIEEVSKTKASFKSGALRFEAGTQNIAGVIGFGAALTYLQKIGFDKITAQDKSLMEAAMSGLQNSRKVKIYGSADPANHTGIISFNVGEIHPHDVSTVFDLDGVAIRAGHHCAEPLMNRLGVSATCRASFYFYNNLDDVERFLIALKDTEDFFNRHPSKESSNG